ncbi:glycosyltransferase family 4 protein [Rhodobacteraceae bacterium NNCM2]|nr:glycosyltransferase family 4 protein [Coraliihabitans acroporae]
MDLGNCIERPSQDSSGFAEQAAAFRARPSDRTPLEGGLSQMLTPDLRARAAALRAEGAARHILYVPGPGDVAGTYRHWMAGRDDPSIPSIGYSHQVYELAEALGVRLTVLSETAPGEVPGGPVRFRQMARPRGRGAGYHLSDIAYGLRVLRLAREVGADTILMQRMLVHFWPLGLARALGIRLVFSLHNTLWPAGRAPSARAQLIGRLNGWAFRRAAGVVGVSAAAAEQASQLAGPGFDRASVQVPQYKAGLQHLFRARNTGAPLRRLLYAGRVEETKGVFVLLRAFARVAPRHPELALTFLGSGPDLERLREEVAAAGLANRVGMPGAVDGAGVFEAMAASDLLICPTTSRFAEGLAKTPIEAAFCGVPAILSDTVPVADLLGPAVRVVRPDDAEALAREIEGLIEDPAAFARMAEETRTQCAAFFDRRRSLAAQILPALATAR